MNARVRRVEFYTSRGVFIEARRVATTQGLSSQPWIRGPTTTGGTYKRPLVPSHTGALVIWLNDTELPPPGAVTT